MTVIVLGASRGPGRILYDSLCSEGQDVIGIARHRGDTPAERNARFVTMDASHSAALEPLISTDTTLIHCGPPEVLSSLLNHRNLSGRIKRLIAIGSTRLFTQYPDTKQRRVATMANDITQSGVAATLIHPTMIYGAPGLNNIERIIRLARLLPVLPLPAKGSSLIQPVYAPDVVSAIRTCLKLDSTIGKTYILPGPNAMTYREFVLHCTSAAGMDRSVISVPYPLMMLAAPLTRFVPKIPTITQQEVERLLEDKDFDPSDIERALSLSLTSLDEGLSQFFSRLKQT